MAKSLCLVFVLITAWPASVGARVCCEGPVACAVDYAQDNTLTAEEAQAGWRLLFDGSTFQGWGCTAADFGGWSVNDGAIAGTGTGGYIYTAERFGDFELKVDFMVDDGSNSGIFFRWDELDDPVQTGIEMQILDSAGKKTPGKHDCGALYDILSPSENAMKPAHEWNSVIIKCRGPFVSIDMNGKSIIRADLSKYTVPHKNIDGSSNKFSRALKDFARSGHIGFQAHGRPVWFKNVKVRAIDK